MEQVAIFTIAEGEEEGLQIGIYPKDVTCILKSTAFTIEMHTIQGNYQFVGNVLSAILALAKAYKAI